PIESVSAYIPMENSMEGAASLHPLPGDNSCVEPPDSIPNSEVKRARADGSVHLACESRSSPGSLPKTPQLRLRGFSFARFLLRVVRERGCGIGVRDWIDRGLTGPAAAGRPLRSVSPGIRLAAYSSSFTYAQRPPGHDGFGSGQGSFRATPGLGYGQGQLPGYGEFGSGRRRPCD